MGIPHDRVAHESAGRNFETRGSAISIATSTRATRNFNSQNFNHFDNNSSMGITLPDDGTTRTGILLGLDPPVMESDPTVINWATLDSLESTLLEENVDVSFGEDSLQEFLLDQDVGSVTLCDSPQLPISHKVPYKEMPNFGNSETGLTRPLLSVVGTAMECDEVGVSRVDSSPPPAPVTAPCSPQASTNQTKVLSTINSNPVTNPVELQPAAGEEQGILYGEPSSAPADDEGTSRLALPQALVTRQSWVSRDTNRKIGEACGETGNRICRQCMRKFSSTRRLHVHAPQH